MHQQSFFYPQQQMFMSPYPPQAMIQQPQQQTNVINIQPRQPEGTMNMFGSPQLATSGTDSYHAKSAESEAMSVIRDVTGVAESVYMVARLEPEILFGDVVVKGYSKTISMEILTRLDIQIAKLITSLSIATKHLMEKSHFQTDLINCCTRIQEMVECMREYSSMRGMCCLPAGPFNGNKKMEQLATQLEKRVINCKSTFELQFTVHGVTGVSGQAGQSVQLDRAGKTTIKEVDKTVYNMDGRAEVQIYHTDGTPIAAIKQHHDEQQKQNNSQVLALLQRVQGKSTPTDTTTVTAPSNPPAYSAAV